MALSTPKGGHGVKRETGDAGESWAGVATQTDPMVTAVEPSVERFTIPREQEGLLDRPRLFEELELGVGGALTLVSAPAGSGKTVLVSAWARRARAHRPIAWIGLEAGDELANGFWWSFTEARGMGDLRPYLLLQGAPLVLVPLWQHFARSPLESRIAFGIAIVLYAIAKGAEFGDHAIFHALGFVSGHTLKHLLAVAAGALIAASAVRTHRQHPATFDPHSVAIR